MIYCVKLLDTSVVNICAKLLNVLLASLTCYNVGVFFNVLFDTLSARKEKCWLIKGCKLPPFSILARNNSSGEVIFFLGFSGFFVRSVIILYLC